LTISFAILAVVFLMCVHGHRTAFSASPGVVNRQQPVELLRIPYVQRPDGTVEDRQSLDLLLPPLSLRRPPLVIFIHGGFWMLADDQYQIGRAVALPLLRSGVAVAVVRYRLAPTYRHPAQVKDLAAAIAYLVREADRYGYDGARIYLAGHSAGAHLAALVALDPAYLKAEGLQPGVIAGVIGISGIYDLAPKIRVAEDQSEAVHITFGQDAKTLKAASPVAHVNSKAPPFLILSAAADFTGLQIDARRFAEALRRSGNKRVDQYDLRDQDHFSITQLGGKSPEARALVLDFLKVEPLPPELAILIEAKRRWVRPPFSTAPFWQHESLIRSYPIDARFVRHLISIYEDVRYELREWPLERFYAIDLFDYLDSLPPERVGQGDYLVTTNVRDEKQFWKRGDIAPYKPVIVVGIDDEKNLFRFGVFYRALREYSWKPGPQPPMMARPVGAFLYFLEEPPAQLAPRAGHYALTVDGFKLVAEDPLAPLADLPKPVYETLTFRNGCVYCHGFRAMAARSHHSVAATGAARGGFALPLESYPAQVWKAFMFDQMNVAKKIGASPNVVDADAREALYKLVAEARGESVPANEKTKVEGDTSKAP